MEQPAEQPAPAPYSVGGSAGPLTTMLARLDQFHAPDMVTVRFVEHDVTHLPIFEKCCAAGHLRAIHASLSAARDFVNDAGAVARVAAVRRTLAKSLFVALRLPMPPPITIRQAFGLFTEEHCASMRISISAGMINEIDAAFLAYNGDLIALALGRPKGQEPLNFETSLGVARRRLDAEAPSMPVSIGGPGARMIVSNAYEFWRAANVRALEPETLDWIRHGLCPGDTLYDVGANIGVFTLHAASLQRSARVIAIEPEPANFARLNENIRLNGLANVIALPVALSDQSGVGIFAARDAAPGAAAPFALMQEHAEERHRCGCMMQTLDGLVAAMDVSDIPTHVKIDVDGHQIPILRGAVRTLSDTRLRSVLIELFDNELPEADGLMAAGGLKRSDTFTHTEPLGERGRVSNHIYVRL